MEYINEELQIIQSKNVRGRIERELKELYELNLIDPYGVSVSVGTDNQNPYDKTLYIINFYNLKDNKLYEFKFNSNYPFRPPKLFINFKPYSYYYYLNISSHDFKQNLLKYYKIRCMCCETVLCADNWSPAYKMSTILNEVERFKLICKNLSYRVIINVIKRKYLVDDINILDWLI